MSWSDLLESVFASVRLALLRSSGELAFEQMKQLHAVDSSLARLRDAVVRQRDDQTISRLARDAHRQTQALARVLEASPARSAVSRLLGVLTPYVSIHKVAA
jgi:hypothetical protein